MRSLSRKRQFSRYLACLDQDFWFYAGCVNLDENLYSQHVSSDSSRWFCPSCQDKETSGTLLDSDEDTDDEESNLDATSSTQEKTKKRRLSSGFY